MTRYLYIFAGFPGKRVEGTPYVSGRTALHAGGLQYCIEENENLAELEHSPHIQVRKPGVFVVTDGGDELLESFEPVMSPALERDGITWDWFPEDFAFGNGVSTHKTFASPDYKIVVHGTELNLEEFLAENGTTRLAELELERMHVKHEGWQEYEARWLPGTCPIEPHAVHLTWLVTTHKLPDFAYERIRALIEGGAEPEQAEIYIRPDAPGKYLSTPRPFKEEKYAVPQHS